MGILSVRKNTPHTETECARLGGDGEGGGQECGVGWGLQQLCLLVLTLPLLSQTLILFLFFLTKKLQPSQLSECLHNMLLMHIYNYYDRDVH